MESHRPLEQELKAGWAGSRQLTGHYVPPAGQPRPLLFSSSVAREELLL